MSILSNIIKWLNTFGYREVPVWYDSSKATINEFQTIGKHLKILKLIPNPFPFYDLIMGFYERGSNREALRGPVMERSRKIIDVGAGTGYLLSRLIRATREDQAIVAVDLSEQMLKNTKAYLLKKKQLTFRVTFETADCRTLPW